MKTRSAQPVTVCQSTGYNTLIYAVASTRKASAERVHSSVHSTNHAEPCSFSTKSLSAHGDVCKLKRTARPSPRVPKLVCCEKFAVSTAQYPTAFETEFF